MSYKELSYELKVTIAKAKKFPVGSFRHVKLKLKATALHKELLKIEKMINNFK